MNDNPSDTGRPAQRLSAGDGLGVTAPSPVVADIGLAAQASLASMACCVTCITSASDLPLAASTRLMRFWNCIMA